MDFDRYDELHKRGYDATIELMDSIKGRIARRVPLEEVNERRANFKSKLPKFVFRNVIVKGVSHEQEKYISKEFHANMNETFDLEDMRRGYFRLLSDDMISEVLPHAVYNYEDETFDLIVNVKMSRRCNLRIGGSVGSNSANQIYLGATYHNLNNFSKEFSIDGQLGQLYNNLQLSARMDLPTKLPTSYRFVAAISSFDYLKQDKIFTSSHSPAFNKQDEIFFKSFVSFPFLSNQKVEFGLGCASLNDQYFQTNVIDFSNAVRDKSRYNLIGGSVALEGNTLNSKQYATAGRKERVSAHIYTGKEIFTSAIPGSEKYKFRQTWLQLAYELEKYHSLQKNLSLGYYIKAYYSSRNFANNYFASMLQAGEFSPTAHSVITYNEHFRANQFMGVGLFPIYEFNPMLHARLSVYGFLPIFPIRKDESNRAYYGKVFTKFEYMSEASLVMKLPFGSICLYANHYSSPKREWNFGLSLGWQIFGRRFID